MSESAPVCSEKNGNTSHSSLRTSKNCCKKWCFTFNNYHINHIEMIKSALEKLCVKFVFQQEIGLNGTPHLQGAIWLKKKARWTEFKLPKEIHWEPMRNEDASEAYCQKSETSVGEPIIYGFPKPKKPLKLIKNLFKWQESIEKTLLIEPDSRTINWLFDPVGNIGKTEFIKYLYNKLNGKIIVATAGDCKDIACLFAKTIEKNPEFDINDDISFILNLPKNQNPDRISYTMLESIKDGMITNLKYETDTLIFNRPHIWVFANCLPSNDINGRIIEWIIENGELSKNSCELN